MALQFNNSVDQPGTPNQASPGPISSAGSPAGAGLAVPAGGTVTTIIHRRGVVTLVSLLGRINQSATQHLQFGPAATEGWLPGDIVFIQCPSTGGTPTGIITVNDTAANVLVTWPSPAGGPALATGGMFVFGAGVIALGDFGSVVSGPSTT